VQRVQTFRAPAARRSVRPAGAPAARPPLPLLPRRRCCTAAARHAAPPPAAMEFREFSWAQQLYRQRLIYGPAAEATEKSYPKYPAPALRELVRQSKHPHNLEPLLLTLRRPENEDTRRRFAEVAGELVLIERIMSDDVICDDLQVVIGGRVEQAEDGILYPDRASKVRRAGRGGQQRGPGLGRRAAAWRVAEWRVAEWRVAAWRCAAASHAWALPHASASTPPPACPPPPNRPPQVPYEAWVRVEMLDALTLMLSEGLVQSLTPAMQGKLIADLLERAQDAGRHPLLRGYALRAAATASLVLNPARCELAAGAPAAAALTRAACAALRLGTERGAPAGAGALEEAPPATASADSDASMGGGAEKSADGGEPAAAPATNPFAGDPLERMKLLAAGCTALYLAAAGPDAAGAAAFPDGAAPGAPLGDATKLPDVAALARAGAGPLLARAVEAAAAALVDRLSAAAGAEPVAPGGDARSEAEREAEEERRAAGELSFEDNWAEYLKAGFSKPDVVRDASAVVALGGALLQLLAASGGAAESDERAWPREAALEALTLAAGGEGHVVGAVGAALAKAGEGGAAAGAVPAVVGLEPFSQVARALLARRCDACGAREGVASAPAALKRCGACARAFYCSERCQKKAWGAGHKAACKQLAAAAKASPSA
jgi:hypothetical protein